MKKFHVLLAILIISCSPNIKDTGIPITTGVPLTLAENRAQQLSEVNYRLAFTIPKLLTEPIPAHLVVSFDLFETKNEVVLDFKEASDHLISILTNGVETPILYQNEHIIINPKYLKKGKNELQLEFILGELSLNRNQDYLYTLLVPDRARTLFPCFDQPDIKATYDLTITAPENWMVLCGAKEKAAVKKGQFTEHQFKTTDQMSTYLFSFVAGNFKAGNREIHNFPMNMLYREDDHQKIAYSTDSIFQLHVVSKNFLENYTSFPFPFQKLDFASIPGFQYGGMEHVGAIQYKENALFLDQSATEKQKLGRAKLIAHETAHMWFGNLVTMKWFNDVWMKEVFANFMADKIVNPAFPNINHELSFMLSHYPSAYNEDRTLGTNPIRQTLENLNNAGSLYGSIIYDKAPIMMRQLEKEIGEKSFQRGIQKYVGKYAYGNAVWDDLISILDEGTKEDLKTWSQVWVNSSGRPQFSQAIKYDDNGKIIDFQLSQNAEDGSGNIWPQSFDISLFYADSVRKISIKIKDRSTQITEALGLPKPLAILYNSDGMGYGIFPILPSDLAFINTISDEIMRGYTYINVYENALAGNLPMKDTFAFFKKSLSVEKNELLLNLVSGYLHEIFWIFLTPNEREASQPELENQLKQQLHSELPPNIKKILFNSFRSVAYSNTGKEQLYAIWNKDISISNLRLNQDDYTALAMSLALYGHKNTESILATAQKQLTNQDKIDRFVYILPALSHKEPVRKQFFESLKITQNRSKESWTITALGYLNHPLRQNASIAYLRPSLDLLEEIQQTGDIFFPKRWLVSTVGQYSSKEAYQIVTKFITENPNLNPALLKKLLQASDNLRRLQK